MRTPTGTTARFRAPRAVEWGDCDAAGIVFYPNYHRWMDGAFHALCRSRGFDQASLAAEHGLLGTPLREARCEFLSPARCGDVLVVAAAIERLGTSSIRLSYAFDRGAVPVARGVEVRVFVRDAGRGLEAVPVPEAVRTALAPLLGELAR